MHLPTPELAAFCTSQSPGSRETTLPAGAAVRGHLRMAAWTGSTPTGSFMTFTEGTATYSLQEPTPRRRITSSPPRNPSARDSCTTPQPSRPAPGVRQYGLQTINSLYKIDVRRIDRGRLHPDQNFSLLRNGNGAGNVLQHFLGLHAAFGKLCIMILTHAFTFSWNAPPCKRRIRFTREQSAIIPLP